MIDTHQHLLEPTRFNYSWARSVPALQGTFGLAEYHAAAQKCGITGTVFMEVDVDGAQSAHEARYFCGLADDPTSGILGVVAASRPEEDGFETHLDNITHPKLVGIRRVLHTQPDEISKNSLFRRNIGLLGERGLIFEICVLQRQLGIARDLVRACPGTTFILDHCGVPEIATNDAPYGEGFVAWQKGVHAIATEPNVICKISGLSAYSREDQRTKESLAPYVDTVLEAFGPPRCLWGGDWPVVNLGSGLSRWCALTFELLHSLTTREQTCILSENARRIYSLDL